MAPTNSYGDLRLRFIHCPDYTRDDALTRWGDPNRIAQNEVRRACPWCASWLRQKGDTEGPFDSIVSCVNLACTMLPTGGCYWEPWPDGWTAENKQRWNQRADHLSTKGATECKPAT